MLQVATAAFKLLIPNARSTAESSPTSTIMVRNGAGSENGRSWCGWASKRRCDNMRVPGHVESSLCIVK